MSNSDKSGAPPPQYQYQKRRPNAQSPSQGADRRLFDNASDFAIYGGEFNAVGGNVYRSTNDMRYGTNYNGQSTHNQTEIAKGGTFHGQEFNFGDRTFQGPTHNYSGTTSYQTGSAHVDQRGAQDIKHTAGFPARENLGPGYEKNAEYRGSNTERQHKDREERAPPREWDGAKRNSDNQQGYRRHGAETYQDQQYSPAPNMTTARERNSPSPPSRISRERSSQTEQVKSAFISCIKSEPHPSQSQKESKRRLIREFIYYIETREPEARKDLDETIAEYTEAHKDIGSPHLRKLLFKTLGRYLNKECQEYLEGFLDVCEEWELDTEAADGDTRA